MSTNDQADEVPVLIVGGGPVGMTLSLFLDRLGIESLVVERDESTTDHPKARGCSARTMEAFRVLGLEEEIRALGLGPDSDAIWLAESGSGPILGVPAMEPAVNSPGRRGSTTTQELIEGVLAEAVDAARLSTMRFSTEFVSLQQEAAGVTARVRDLRSGEQTDIFAQYLIGCDGGGSAVRKALGQEMTGPVLGTVHTYYYRTNPDQLPDYVGTVAGILCVPTDPRVPLGSAIAFTGDCTDMWTYAENVRDPDQPFRSEDELVDIVRAQWAIPDLEVELKSRWRWRLSAWMPDRFREGRVMLAGDAAHLVPPAGGMGMNAGVADAQNLAWKLAYVVRGVASDRLLDTFEIERRPVIEWIMGWATGNVGRILLSLPEAAAKRRDEPKVWQDLVLDFTGHTMSAGVSMGYVYEKGAVIDDGSIVPELDPKIYWPTDRPGARFPHLWVERHDETSTIDWFDTDFVLVCGPDGEEWRKAGEHAAATAGTPLVVRTLPSLAGPVSMKGDEAVLVRPDGHVAWRPGDLPGDKATALAEALDFLLAGGTASEAAVPPPGTVGVSGIIGSHR